MSLMAQRFEEELTLLRGRLVEMATATEEIVRDSIIALTHQDMPLAASIIPRDDIIDRMDREMDALCLRLMAKYQPVAANLRLVSAVMKVITDIERIGDHAVDISRISQRMEREMVYKPLVDIPRMGELAREMLHDSIEAFIHGDIALVERVLRADDVVDDLYDRMRRELQETMQSDPTSVMQASYLLFVAHYLERMCDHCCNIVERVAFIETGRLHGQMPILAPDNPTTAENRVTATA